MQVGRDSVRLVLQYIDAGLVNKRGPVRSPLNVEEPVLLHRGFPPQLVCYRAVATVPVVAQPVPLRGVALVPLGFPPFTRRERWKTKQV